MVQAARIIDTGLTTTGLIGAGVGIKLKIKRSFSTSIRKNFPSDDTNENTKVENWLNQQNEQQYEFKQESIAESDVEMRSNSSEDSDSSGDVSMESYNSAEEQHNLSIRQIDDQADTRVQTGQTTTLASYVHEKVELGAEEIINDTGETSEDGNNPSRLVDEVKYLRQIQEDPETVTERNVAGMMKVGPKSHLFDSINLNTSEVKAEQANDILKVINEAGYRCDSFSQMRIGNNLERVREKNKSLREDLNTLDSSCFGNNANSNASSNNESVKVKVGQNSETGELNTPERGSLIDDYANPMDEMPSYMDPED